MPRANAISGRFWALVFFVLVVAVSSTMATVWFTVTPFLERQQTETLKNVSNDVVRDIYDKISDRAQFLKYVASSPAVIDLAIGNAENSDASILHFESLKGPSSVRAFYIYDVLDNPLVQYDAQAETTKLAEDEELSKLTKQILEQKNAKASTFAVHYERSGYLEGLFIATPILKFGLIEGVLIGVFQEELLLQRLLERDIASSFNLLRADQVSQFLTYASESIVSPIPQTDFFIAFTPDRAKIQEAGKDLLRTVALSIGIVLLLPFAIFAFYGRRALVEPHIALQASEEILKKQKKDLAELAAIAENANDAIVVTDLDSKILWANPHFEDLTGYLASEAIGRDPKNFLQGPETDRNETKKIRDAINHFKPIQTELVNYTASGAPYWISISISPLLDDHGEPYGFMAISRDISEEKQQRTELETAKREIEHQALHDALTQLPNRRALDLAIQKRLDRPLTDITLIRIDLDHFKYVNDTLGHDAGDFTLCQVAKILNECVTDGCLPVRVGGDEFVILLPEGHDLEDGRRMAETIRLRIAEPMTYNGRLIQIGSSFGVASSCDGLVSAKDVIAAADSALYLAKDDGRNNVGCYTPRAHKSVVHTRHIADAVREAIIREEFEPYFQPQIDAATGEVAGLETLVRWPTKNEGLLFPDQFLPVADRMSLVSDIDAIVLRKALATMEKLDRKGIRVPKLSLNITAPRLQDPLALETITKHAPKWLYVSYEILESALMDDLADRVKYSLHCLREAGIGIEIDDFGSGHASIVGLLQIRPDAMKVDKRLVMPILESDLSRKLLASIIEIGKSLGIKITAEGVETIEHSRILAELGCDTLQGHHFALPMSATDLEKYLRVKPYEFRAAV